MHMSANKKKNTNDLFRISVTLQKSHFMAIKQEANRSYSDCSKIVAQLVQKWYEEKKEATNEPS